MKRDITFCMLGALFLAGCLGVDTETVDAPTVVAFDPAPVSPDEDHLLLPQVPQPSNFLLDPATGLVYIPDESYLQILGGDTVTVQNFATETVDELIESHFNALYGFPTSGATATAALGAALVDSVASEAAYVLDVTDLVGVGAIREEGVIATLGEATETPRGIRTPISFAPPPEGWIQGRTYAAVITSGVLDDDGEPLRAAYAFNFLKSTAPLVRDGRSICALPDASAVQLEALRLPLAPLFQHLETTGVAGGEVVPREDIAQLWTFTIRPGTIVRYDLMSQVFPTPNDLLLTGPASTPFDCDEDGENDCLAGHLCFPIDCEAGFENASGSFFAFMNSLDGWPASLLPSVPFSLPIDSATVTGDTVQLYDLETGEPLVGTTWSWDPVANALGIVPGSVAAGGRYAVMVARGIRNADGAFSAAPDDTMGILKLTRSLVDEEGHSLIGELGLAGGDPAAEDGLAGLLEMLRLQTDALLKAVGMDGARHDVAAIWSYGIHTGNEALFDPIGGVVPYPNDLLMALDASGNPERVAIPVPDDPVLGPMVEAMNTLDGFSTLTPARTRFLRDLDTGNFRALADAFELLDPDLGGSTIAVVGLPPEVDITSGDLDLLTLVVEGQLDVLADDRVELGFSDGQLEIRPRPGFPLKPGWKYIIAVLDATRSLEKGPDQEPYPIQVSPIFFLARSPYPLYDAEAEASLVPGVLDVNAAALLEQLRANYDLFFTALEDAASLDRARILLLWTFTTQRVTAWVGDLRTSLADLTVPGEVSATLKTPAAYGYADLDAVANLATDGHFEGFTALSPPDLSDPAAPVFSRLLFDDDRALQWTPTSLPFSLSVPHGAGPFRVAIVQHGLWGQRADFISLANDFAAAGWVLVSMDLPLHGDRALDGEDSGAAFFNPDPVSVRDNLVASVLDQIQLVRFIQSPQGLASLLPGVTLDTIRVDYVGESLGGMVGALLLGVEPAVEVGALVCMAGHLTRLLEETQNDAFQQPINEALAAMGIEKGTAAYVQFLETAQMLLDRGDPVNFAAEYAALDVPPRLLVITAGDEVGDGFMPRGAAQEFACAARHVDARHGDYPYTRHFDGVCGDSPHEGVCNGFFLLPEDAPDAAADARAIVIEFFQSDGIPGDEVGLTPGTALDCSFGTQGGGS